MGFQKTLDDVAQAYPFQSNFGNFLKIASSLMKSFSGKSGGEGQAQIAQILEQSKARLKNAARQNAQAVSPQILSRFQFPHRSNEAFIPRSYQPSSYNVFNTNSGMTGGNMNNETMLNRFQIPNRYPDSNTNFVTNAGGVSDSIPSSTNPFIRDIHF